jgi:hypothetical protein
LPWQKIDAVFSASVDLGVAMLPAVPLNFCDGDALNADIRYRLSNLVQLERFDDGGDQLHAFIPAFTRLSDSLQLHFRVLLILRLQLPCHSAGGPIINELRIWGNGRTDVAQTAIDALSSACDQLGFLEGHP